MRPKNELSPFQESRFQACVSAIENLKQAVALVPGEAKYQYGLGRVCRDEEMIDEALE